MLTTSASPAFAGTLQWHFPLLCCYIDFHVLNSVFLPPLLQLRSWGAHYKGITCLAFSESGLMLFSGAEDTLASCWLLGELLDPLRDPSSPDYHRPQPLHSW